MRLIKHIFCVYVYIYILLLLETFSVGCMLKEIRLKMTVFFYVTGLNWST
jgi:hypothetical protein